jgi:hypothetical protein
MKPANPVTPANCHTCSHPRDFDGVKLCGLVYSPGRVTEPAKVASVGAWLNANMDRKAWPARPKDGATGCPMYSDAVCGF